MHGLGPSPGSGIERTLYDRAAKTLFAAVTAVLTDLVVLDLMLIIHEKTGIFETDAVKIFCKI